MIRHVIPINSFATSTRKQIRERLEGVGFNFAKGIVTEVKGDKVYFEQEERAKDGEKDRKSEEKVFNR